VQSCLHNGDMSTVKTDSAQDFFNARRREAVNLPSWRKHAVLAGISFCVLAAIPFLMTNILGNADDAQSFGSVVIEPVKEIAALAPLDDEALPVPDILAGELGAGENPTQNANLQNSQLQNSGLQNSGQNRDALGNLIGAANGTGNGPALSPVTNAPQNLTGASTGPKTILIDGQAIGASSLPPAPFVGLTGSNQYGRAPIKGPNGQTALNSYNRPFTLPSGASGKTPVSIIIGGLGINRSVTQQAIDSLPPDVTLSFAAHTAGLQDWINRARSAGHEVMIEIPMDSAQFDASEKGADKALRVSNPASKNLRNMDWLLSRGQGYFGVINYNGDNLLTRADVSAPILSKLSDSGLGFITDGAFSAPSLGALSRSVNLPYKSGFGLIDPEPNTQIIRAQLSNLSNLAASNSRPIGVGFAYPETIESVARWAATLDTQNLILAPASFTLIQ